ncbi:hypothetical protein, partial [Vibrio anguillarum]|uniref:hypothetical protein n=1 Tax=Vibrio anguillarum TaxID=55601 RepID=UPI001BE4C606
PDTSVSFSLLSSTLRLLIVAVVIFLFIGINDPLLSKHRAVYHLCSKTRFLCSKYVADSLYSDEQE